MHTLPVLAALLTLGCTSAQRPADAGIDASSDTSAFRPPMRPNTMAHPTQQEVDFITRIVSYMCGT